VVNFGDRLIGGHIVDMVVRMMKVLDMDDSRALPLQAKCELLLDETGLDVLFL